MEYLENEWFSTENELCQFANDNAVSVVSIIYNDYKWVLFYKKRLD